MWYYHNCHWGFLYNRENSGWYAVSFQNYPIAVCWGKGGNDNNREQGGNYFLFQKWYPIMNFYVQPKKPKIFLQGQEAACVALPKSFSFLLFRGMKDCLSRYVFQAVIVVLQSSWQKLYRFPLQNCYDQHCLSMENFHKDWFLLWYNKKILLQSHVTLPKIRGLAGCSNEGKKNQCGYYLSQFWLVVQIISFHIPALCGRSGNIIKCFPALHLGNAWISQKIQITFLI